MVDTTNIEIESGIPLPERASRLNDKWRLIFDKMKVGDSFPLVDAGEIETNNLTRAVGYMNKQSKLRPDKYPMQFSWRRFGKGQIRVWRVR